MNKDETYIIDAHMHFSDLGAYRDKALGIKAPVTLDGVLEYMAASNVVLAIGMGIDDLSGQAASFQPPMLLSLSRQWCPETGPYHKRIACCPGVDPWQLLHHPQPYIRTLAELCALDYVVGLKIYLGYFPFYASDEIYAPVFDLCRAHDITLVMHTGDVSSPDAFLKYAHPLSVDEVAVRHRKCKIVMAHFGNPWLFDAASVALKNDNVFLDMSGLVVGKFTVEQLYKTQPGYIRYLKSAIAYLFDYDKLMYASDWPFAPIVNYIDFIKSIIPEKQHENVFFKNALYIYRRLSAMLEKIYET